jgi:DNA modification methylase
VNKIIVGDVRDKLKTLPDKSVQCVVTSPPYWGLRDYKNDNQIGLEKTFTEYVKNLTSIFNEVKRIIKDDGVLWLNLGDTYASKDDLINGIKGKNLIGIPWRVAFALQEDGWYLRQDIIWAKPNPMPEPVKDRCTKSHEHIFMFTKSPHYYFDSETIREPRVSSSNNHQFGGKKYNDPNNPIYASPGSIYKSDGKRNKRDVWFIPTQPFAGSHFAVMPEALVEPCILSSSKEKDIVLDPFFGAGTVGVVSKRNNRKYIGIELNPDYALIAEKRIKNI